MNATEAVAALADLDYEALPSAVLERAKSSIRDVIGVAIYGAHHEVGDLITAYVERTSPGDDARLFGRGRASPTGAALANGTYAHAIDYDDTFESIVLHPSAPVFPAALAAAELVEAPGHALLAGYVAGVEAAFRVGHSVYPSHYDHGWHLTGTAGSFGSAIAAASILGLPSGQTRHAVGIVASGSSALKKNFGSMTKPLHPGHAAQTGLRSALLAKEGFTADEQILDGEMGYGEVMSPDGEFDPSVIVDGLDTWGLLDNGFKPYPSGVISHAAMECLRRIVVEQDLAPDEVSRVRVTLDKAADEMLIHAQPANELQAKFSIEFCLAAILLERNPGVQTFDDEYVTAPDTRREMAKVERQFEENLFDGEFAGYGARVVVETAAGDRFVAEETEAPGSPSNPLDDERWLQKFDDCVSPVLGDDASRALLAAIEELEDPDAVTRLVAAAGQE